MLKEITYEITTLCGANCVMCERKKHVHEYKSMTIDEILMYTKKAVEAGYNAIIMGGMGDPMLHPQIKDVLTTLKATYPDVSIRLTTTGQFLTEDNLETVCNCVDILKISNYGFTKNVYESVHRGSLVFEDVQKNLERLADYKGKKPNIIMSFLYMDINKSDVYDWIEYWTKKGFEEVNVWKCHNWGGHLTEREQLSDARTYCERIRNRHFKVWVNGKVSVCTFDCEKRLLLGDLKSEDFTTINQKYERIKEIHDTGKVYNMNADCGNCDQIYSRDNALLYLNLDGKIEKNIIENG